MSPAELRQATADHLDKMDTAIRTAGIVPDEPLAPVLAEWRRSLAWVGELTARMAEISEMIDARVSALPASGSATIDPAALVLIEEAAVKGASAQAARLARTYSWRTGLLAGVILTGAVVFATFVGYMAGRNSAVATSSAIEAAATRDGPQAADLWLTWMRDNDGQALVRACDAATVKSDGGRRGCGVGLWLEPPANSLPRTAPASK